MKVLNANIFFIPYVLILFNYFIQDCHKPILQKIYMLFDSSFEQSLLTQIYQ